MVDSVKGYSLPSGYASVLGPSDLEQIFAGGLARNGLPSGILTGFMHDARRDRMAAGQQFTDALMDAQNRTSALNDAVIKADREKMLTGVLKDAALAEKPGTISILMPIIDQILGAQGVGDGGRRALAGQVADTQRRVGEMQDAQTYNQRMEGFERGTRGGFQLPLGSGLTPDLLPTAAGNIRPHVDVQREQVREAGQTTRDTKPRANTTFKIGNRDFNLTAPSISELQKMIKQHEQEITPPVTPPPQGDLAPAPAPQTGTAPPVPTSRTSGPVPRKVQLGWEETKKWAAQTGHKITSNSPTFDPRTGEWTLTVSKNGKIGSMAIRPDTGRAYFTRNPDQQ